MKILLINPDFTADAGRDLYTGDILTTLVTFIPTKRVYNGFPLALPTLASVTPKEHTVKIIDESIESINFDEECDLVGITAMTFKATRAYQIAKEFRSRGKTVILGGIHASMCPNEASGHADCIVKGEAEEIWPGILKDFENGRLKKIYQADKFTDISKLPIPRYDLVKLGRYYLVYLQTSRGCPYDCAFCTVTKMNGRKMRFKSPKQVISEIDYILKRIPYPPVKIKDRSDGKLKYYYASFFFTDDNFAINRTHAIAVSNEIIRYQKENNKIFTWFTQVNYGVGLDDELLEIFSKANCEGLFMGFESLDPNSLKAMNKTMNSPELYSKSIENVRRHGMECIFSTIVGGDHDTLKTFDILVDFINKNQIFFVLPNILTPYPGTHLYEKMNQEGRIIDKEPSNYNIRNVVFEPKNMTPFELQQAYVDLCNRIFRMDKMIPRSKKMLSYAHKQYKFILPFFVRTVSFLLFLYSAITLCFQKRLKFNVLLPLVYNLITNLLIKGTLVDLYHLAWILDNDAFAKSETSRLPSLKQKFDKTRGAAATKQPY